MQDTIHFVVTGGTIDSFYDGVKDTVVPLKHTILPRFFQGLKLSQKIIFDEVCMKDSRSIDQKDRTAILKRVEKSKSKQVLITHGTYTMGDTARFLQVNLKRKDQVIVLTGSFIPLEGFVMSDGGFNLGYALAQTQVLRPGVYVCMNGKVLTSQEAIKISSNGMFDSIFGEKK